MEVVRNHLDRVQPNWKEAPLAELNAALACHCSFTDDTDRSKSSECSKSLEKQMENIRAYLYRVKPDWLEAPTPLATQPSVVIHDRFRGYEKKGTLQISEKNVNNARFGPLKKQCSGSVKKI
uniref:INCENP_ARK-bind domain-containing protein n=1 Tax=Caenorhabditis tropicalis TaxID=1561998 RepID=A0A1I7TT68_9PELO